MATIQLKVTRPGSVLSLLIDREISEQQLAAIEIVLNDDRMAFNVIEDAKADQKVYELYRIERPPVGGIEQYQAEDR